MLLPDNEDVGAVFSPCRTWRYALFRRWQVGPRVTFVLLNPSTADETKDDPTIRRCMAFARSWGWCGLVIVNLFAIRSTDPRAILEFDEPVGVENDRQILRWCLAACVDGAPVVLGWGTATGLLGRTIRRRGEHVYDMLQHAGILAHCLGTTQSGQPRHPLYLAGDTLLAPYQEL